jgi:O-acetylserine/cysteine efflux transporter
MNRRPSPLVGLMVASILWGGAITGTKYALAGFDPYTLLLVQLLSATTFLWVVLLRRGYRLPRSWRLVIALGLLEPGIAYLAETFGLSHTSAAAGSVISGLESAFVVVLAAVLLAERVRRGTAIAIVLAFVGLLVLEGTAPWSGPGLGDLFVAVGVLSASAYTIVVKKYPWETDSLTLTTHQFTVATMLATAVLGGRWVTGAGSSPATVATRYWCAAVLVGVLGYAASFLLFNSLIQEIGAGTSSVVLNLIPVFGVLSAIVLLHESLDLATATGALLIALSVVCFVVVEHAGRTPAPIPAAVPAVRRELGGSTVAAGPSASHPDRGPASAGHPAWSRS